MRLIVSNSRPPRLPAFLLAIGLVSSVLVASPARAFPPQMLESDSADGASLSAPPFPTPEALRPAIRFWKLLFTQHGSDRVVVHDREDLDVVWRVLELPRKDDGSIDEAAADKLVKRAVEDLKQRLARLAADPTPSDEDDRVLLSLAGNSAPRLTGASERLRTQRGVADHFREGFLRSQQWLDGIRGVLAEQGVPTEIAVLPFVESMYNPGARSYAGAVGAWQLMPATARDYGLKVGRDRDDRRDVLKAARAAARLLKQNYRLLGSWPLAITGYNYGPFGLKRVCDRLGTTDLATLIGTEEHAPLGFAARNFYAEFLAAIEAVAETQAASSLSSVRD
jgi:membrane-bound lytic murein transglycosylase D